MAPHYLEQELFTLIRRDSSIFEFLERGSLDGIWYWDLENPEHEWLSPQFWRTLGYEPSEKKHLASEWQDLIHPEDLKTALDNFHKHLADPAHPYDQLVRYTHKNGATVWVRCRGVAIRDDTGKPVRMLGAHNELTRQKTIQKELEASQARYRALFDHINTGVAVYKTENNGKDFVIVDFNKAGERIDNVRREDVIGKNILEMFPGAEPFGLLTALRKVWKTGESEHLPINFYTDDTLSGWRDNFVYKLPTGEIVSVYNDETERMLAEEALRQSERRFKSVFEFASIGMCLTSVDGRFLAVNQAICDIFGYAKEELESMAFDQITHPEDKEKSRDAVRALLNDSAGARHFEKRYIHKSGAVIHTAVGAILVRDDKNEPQYFVSHVRDITEAKKMESRLQQAQKMEAIGTLAGGIAHDFNNILSPIIGFTEMMTDDIPEGTPLRDYADEIYHAALRARDLVKQILTFSRQAEHEIIPLKLQPIIKESLKLLRASIPTTIGIQYSIDPECGVVVADPTQFHQIIMNLVTNAYHAMEETGGSLKVTLKQVRLPSPSPPSDPPELAPGEYACLTVTDTGTGIPKDILDKVFDPYFTTKEQDKGTGLGLSIVQGIVKSGNGDILIASEPGKGTEIRVYLPILKLNSPEKIADDPGRISGGTEKILLVDDELPIVRMEQHVLERLGYRVVSRTGSIEALEAFKNNPDGFDLVITDMTMPNMTGAQLAMAMKKIRPNLPVIICTGFSDQISEEKCQVWGIEGFVMKPMLKNEIARTIRNVLEKPN